MVVKYVSKFQAMAAQKGVEAVAVEATETEVVRNENAVVAQDLETEKILVVSVIFLEKDNILNLDINIIFCK